MTAVSHILLIGFMGAGKSTVGRAVADRLGLRFLDLDELIEKAGGRPVTRIFEEDGEGGFRRLESAALLTLEDVAPSVIACGGGVVLEAVNRVELRRLGTVVYLQVGAEDALRRIGGAQGRPLLAGAVPAAAASLLRSREALYEAAADIIVPTDGRSISDVVDDVVRASGGAAA